MEFHVIVEPAPVSVSVCSPNQSLTEVMNVEIPVAVPPFTAVCTPITPPSVEATPVISLPVVNLYIPDSV